MHFIFPIFVRGEYILENFALGGGGILGLAYDAPGVASNLQMLSGINGNNCRCSFQVVKNARRTPHEHLQ